jgi:hexosaminidase
MQGQGSLLLVKISRHNLPPIFRQKFALTCSCLLFALWANHAMATVSYYWDINGSTAGAGGGASPTGTWEGADWTTLSGGTSATGNWVEGSIPKFCAGSTATGVYTVTANASHTIAGLYNATAGTTIINGSGTLYLPNTNGLYGGGFQVADVLIISNVLADFGGAGSIQTEATGGAALYLYGTNTFSGGTLLGSLSGSAGTVYFGNNAAFGAGLIQMSANNGTLAAAGNGSYAISNAVAMTNVTINIIGTSAGVTFSGAWDTGGTGPCTLALGGAASNIVTLSGVMSDAEGFVQSGGILVLKGNNTYGTAGAPNGNTVVSGGTLILANANGSATGVSGIVVTNYSSTLTGNGTTAGTVNNAGNISATNLAGGTATLTTGSQTWVANSAYQWAINNAIGAAGTTNGWDKIVVNGGLTNIANSSYPLAVNIISLTAANQPGALAVFNNAQDYSWLILHSTNPPIAGFSASTVIVNSSSFVNDPGAGLFTLSTNNTASGGDLYVNFVHTPSLTVSNVTVNAGSNAVFYATNTVSNATPATAVWAWRSNNVILSDGGRISGSATSTLTISNAQGGDAATYTVSAANAAGENIANATLTVIVTPAVVTWTNPPPIIYGTALGSNQLDATANVPGNFVYTPPGGTVLNVGANTLSAFFTPSNTGQYSGSTNMVSLVVTTAPLSVTASNATRPFGAANPAFTGTIIGLQNSDNITATYSTTATTGSPTGTYPIMPAFVDPNNRLSNYSTTLVNGTLDVGSIITWTPASLTYGAALGSSQLDATANVPGNFVYAPSSGTIFNAGTHMLSATFTPTDNVDYDTTNVSVNLVVSPAPLTATGSNATRPAGIPNPPFTGTITGVTNGDNITATFSCSAISASPPGTYPIVPALVDPNNRQTNYAVSLVNGTFTITAPPPPITAGTPNIIPLPVTLSNLPGIFTLCPSQSVATVPARALMKILVDGASQQTGQYLAAALFKSTGYQFQLATRTATTAVKGAILITTSNAISTLGPEGYELTVAPDSVVIRAPAQGGAFYGVQSLLQLLPPQIYSPRIVTNVAWVAPCVYIKDYPLFSWRGVMLDVARHFFNKQEVKQVLDAMAMHKLNTFHWHLCDDEGWRLEITNYPNLAAVAAWRAGIDMGLAPRATTATNAAGQYGGYYTQADAREIVAYAAERHITVVPEIEMPCHSMAALEAYPIYGCGNPVGDYNPDTIFTCGTCYGVDLWSLGTPGTMTFLEDILAETMAIFPGQYIHCGGDEVVQSGDTQWLNYNADVTNMQANGIDPNDGTTAIYEYQNWFSTTIANFVQAHGHTMIGWTEFEYDGIIPNAALMEWRTGDLSEVTNAVEAGVPVVMSPDANCYINYIEGSGSGNFKTEPPFQFTHSPSYLSVNSIYNFNPVLPGLSAYTNYILGAQCNLWGEYVPSFENVMFKMFPRETALAEITWTPRASQSYTSFTNRLVAQKQRFTQMGVNYDHEAIPQIGSWASVPTSGTTLISDITTNVTAAGEIDVNFWWLSGTPLAISSVALLVNNVQVDVDTHAGTATTSSSYNAAPYIPLFTLYVLHLPELVPGATYYIEAKVAGSGGTSGTGTVYMPNWN